MGKKGAALRAMKKQSASYTFTGEQLAEHDRQVEAAYKARFDRKLREEFEEYDRKQRADFDAHATKLWQESAVTLMSYFFAMACRIMVEEFGWPVPHSNRKNLRLLRYGEALANEMNRVTKVENQALKDYAEETKRLYGIEFCASEE